MSGVEVVASIVTLMGLAGKLLKFGADAKGAGDRNSDLLAQVVLLSEILPRLRHTVEQRQEQTKWRSVTSDEEGLLGSLLQILKSLEGTLMVFDEKVGALVHGSGGWQNMKTQLKWMMSSSDIASLENRISSEVSLLQLMMTCYLWSGKSENNSPDEGVALEIARGINTNMRYIKEHLNRMTSQFNDGANPLGHSTGQIASEAREDFEIENPAKWLDLRMMLDCCQSADAIVKSYSQTTSIVGVNEDTPEDSPMFHGSVGLFDSELVTRIISGYGQQAEEDLRNHAYQAAETNLLKAIHQAYRREEYYGQPFESRYHLETMLAKAYIYQSKFEEAVTTLRSLKPLAEACPKSSAELWYLLTDLCRRRYQASRSRQHFREWEESALKAYNLARTLTSMPDHLTDGNTLHIHAARILIELYEIKQDPVIIEALRERHPETLPEPGHVEAPDRTDPEDWPPVFINPFSRQETSLTQTAVQSCPQGPAQNSLSGVSLGSQASILFESIHNEDTAGINHILAQNTNVTAERDSDGRTPLMCAVKLRNMPFVKTLLHRSPINAHDNNGNTVLHYALFSYNRRGMLELILQHKEINPRLLDTGDNEGRTPLHYCVTFQRLDNAYDLIAHGASLDIEDIAGDTPVALAELDGRKDFQRLFRLAKERTHTEGFQSMSIDERFRYLRELSVGGKTKSAQRRSTSGYEQDKFRRDSNTTRKGRENSMASSHRILKFPSFSRN